jgi:hypothetical protein
VGICRRLEGQSPRRSGRAECLRCSATASVRSGASSIRDQDFNPIDGPALGSLLTPRDGRLYPLHFPFRNSTILYARRVIDKRLRQSGVWRRGDDLPNEKLRATVRERSGEDRARHAIPNARTLALCVWLGTHSPCFSPRARFRPSSLPILTPGPTSPFPK